MKGLTAKGTKEQMLAAAIQSVLRLADFEQEYIKMLKSDGEQPWFPTKELLLNYNINNTDSINTILTKVVGNNNPNFEMVIRHKKRKHIHLVKSIHNDEKLTIIEQGDHENPVAIITGTNNKLIRIPDNIMVDVSKTRRDKLQEDFSMHHPITGELLIYKTHSIIAKKQGKYICIRDGHLFNGLNVAKPIGNTFEIGSIKIIIYRIRSNPLLDIPSTAFVTKTRIDKFDILVHLNNRSSGENLRCTLKNMGYESLAGTFYESHQYSNPNLIRIHCTQLQLKNTDVEELSWKLRIANIGRCHKAVYHKNKQKVTHRRENIINLIKQLAPDEMEMIDEKGLREVPIKTLKKGVEEILNNFNRAAYKDNGRLTVGTLNVRKLGRTPTCVKQAIEEKSCDIIAIQEISRRSMKNINIKHGKHFNRRTKGWPSW